VANIKSQIKRNKQNEKAHERNKAVKTGLKTAVRKFREAAESGDAAQAQELAKDAARNNLRLAPVIGVGCPGLIREDGSIETGAQNLPGNWQSSRFNLPRALREEIPRIGEHETMVVMHNDAVVQGLSELPHVEMIHMSIRVCVFAMGVAGLVAVFAGIVPAFTFTRDGTGVRASGARVAAGRSRLQTSVIAFQSAMSVVLIAGAILLGRSLVNEGRVDPGFRAERMLMMQVDIPRSLAPTSSDDRRLKLFVNDALTSLPGVSRVTAASMPPLSGRTNGQMASPRPSEAMSVSGSNVERMVIFPNYFDALRIPLVAGRRFTEQDVEDGPRVAIVSEAFARRFWPNESAVGKQFRHPNGVPTIVGVVGDVRNKSLDRAAEPVFYLPAMQANARLSFLIETRGEPLAIAAAAQRAVWTAIPGATISEVTSMERLMSRALAPGRYRATLAALFAVIALTLTAVGVAGLAARGVATRLPELCIRIALGATPRRVLALATSRGLGATLAGIVIGLAVTPFTSRWLADYLFQVPVRDATSYFATCGLTAIVCVGATLLATKRLRHADLSAVLRRT